MYAIHQNRMLNKHPHGLMLPSSAQAPAKPSWAEVSIIFRFGQPASQPAGRPTIHPQKYHPDELGS